MWKFNVLLTVFFTSQLVFAQNIPTCGQEYAAAYADNNGHSSYYDPGNPKAGDEIIKLPVVVHVIYSDARPQDSLSHAQVTSQIDVLNQDFMGENADSVNIRSEFVPVFGKAKIQFELATLDPNGVPTTGITYTKSANEYFFSYGNTMMQDATGGAEAWPFDEYLNIWVCVVVDPNSGYEQTGFAVFPWDASSNYDGVVVNPSNFGVNSNSQYYNDGRIGTHEVGHYLGLHHSFRGGCVGETPTTCRTQGDYICDTPPQQAYIQGCDPSLRSCTGNVLAQYENFMDYGIAGCRIMFTKEQVGRMRAYLFTDPIRRAVSNIDEDGLVSSVPEIQVTYTYYPNPVEDFIHLENPLNKELMVRIFDLNGKLVSLSKGSSSLLKLDCFDLKEGSYILQVVDNEQLSYQSKFVKL